MRENDVIVIGAGMAGLTAAAVAAKRGKKVTVLSVGAGTLTIGGGTIDIMGYVGHKLVNSPAEGVTQVAAEHPYAKVGSQAVADAAEFFCTLCAQEGYPYVGSLQETQWIPTAAGTLKPTCLTPKTMDAANLKAAAEVTVVGFAGLKDFYPHLISQNLAKMPGYSDKKYHTVTVKLNLPGGRDMNALDVARYLDTREGQQDAVSCLRGVVKAGSVVIIPPVLGTSASYQVADSLSAALGCTFVETSAVPPSITGLRLRTMLLSYVKKLGVTVIEQATVEKAELENGRCVAVYTAGVDRQRRYAAKEFILANGGFYGGGLSTEPGKVIEPIFNIPVEAPADHEDWTIADLFSQETQPFAKLGIKVNEKLQPLDAENRVVIENVRVAGRNLQGYDFSAEKSGNGVALATGYQAAMLV